MHLRLHSFIAIVWAGISITVSAKDPSTAPQELQEIEDISAHVRALNAEKPGQEEVGAVNPLPVVPPTQSANSRRADTDPDYIWHCCNPHPEGMNPTPAHPEGTRPCGTYATTATDGPCGAWFTAQYSITPWPVPPGTTFTTTTITATHISK
ncbi:MAG: hypothetical protein Q9211_001711 [Gyalolechia sp. 1 TL-2023]